MDSRPPRWSSTRHDDNHRSRYSAHSDRDYHRGRSSYETNSDRRHPDYADREDQWSRSGDYRNSASARHDRGRNSHAYYDGPESRDEDSRYHSRHSSPLHYSDRGRSASPPRHPSAEFSIMPSNELKISGLPRESNYAISSDLIQEQIEALCKTKVSQVRVINDHGSGQPKGFGFVSFPTVDDAVKFYEAHRNNLVIYGNQSDKYDIDLAYALNRQRDRPADPEWICSCGYYNRPTRAVCHKCQSPRENPQTSKHGVRGAGSNENVLPGSLSAYAKSGESDRSPDSAPSRFLLALGLNTKMTAGVLAKGFTKLYNLKSDDSAQSQATKAPTGLRSSTASSQLGAREGSIKRAFLMKDKKTNEPRGYGFVEYHTLEDAIAAIAKFNQETRFTISSGEVDVCYPHTGIFRPILSGPTTYSVEINGQRMAYWDDATYAVEELVNERAPTPDVSIELKPDPSGKKTQKKRKFADDEPRKVHVGSNQAQEFDRWNKAKEQAHNSDLEAAKRQEYLHNLAFAKEQEYVQLSDEKPCCLLCGTKFNSTETAKKHGDESGKHKSNLADTKALMDGMKRLQKRGKLTDVPDILIPPEVATSSEPYVDRAKQRRVETGQPSKISFSLGSKKQQEPADAQSAPEEPQISEKGKGMMEKMGWTGVGGLGASGTGSAGVIPVSMYASGVGLGAAGGNLGDAVEEAGRNTRNDPKEYQEKVRAKARERYENS